MKQLLSVCLLLLRSLLVAVIGQFSDAHRVALHEYPSFGAFRCAVAQGLAHPIATILDHAQGVGLVME